MKRIIVSFSNIDNAKKIRDILIGHGFNVDGLCQSGAQTINLTSTMDEGLVVCGFKLNDMTAPQLKELLPEGFETLVILQPNQLELNYSEDIFSLILPVNKADLVNSVRMIFDMSSASKKKNAKKEPYRKVDRTDEERSIINEAKALLMDRNNMSEEQAHRFIQKTSMNSGLTMVDTAKIILDN